MSREVFVVERRKDRSGWWVMLLAAALIAFWKYLLIMAISAGLTMLAIKGYKKYKYAKAMHDAEQVRIARRADFENAEFLRSGNYEGDYPCATMPVTMAIPQYMLDEAYVPPQVLYPEYDDGLRDWK